MALKVWLPLNKDIKNFGLDNSPAFTNNGATLTTGGVFDKCYSFNGSSNCIAANSLTIDCSHISACAWVYANNSQAAYAYIISLNNGQGYSDHAIALAYESTSNISFTAGGVSSLKTSAIIGSWVHLAVTFDGQKIIGYVNGSKIGELASTVVLTRSRLTIGARNAGTAFQYFFNGKINDVRIYDHALSEEDVKRIYQKNIFDLVPYSGIKNVLFDRSGLMNMPLVNQNAVFKGNALYFNGTNARLRPKNGNVGFNLTGGTLSVWFTPKVIPSDYRLIYIDSTSMFAIGFYTSTTILVVGGSNTSKPCLFPVTFTANTLNNVTIVYDNNYTAIKCVVNGVSKTNDGSLHNWSESNGLTIGGRTYNDTSLFNGKINKVEVFKEQLSVDDAIKLYNSERSLFLPDEYEELEYIQSTGTQYIDLGVKANFDTKVEFTFRFPEHVSNGGYMFGSRSAQSVKAFIVGLNQGTLSQSDWLFAQFDTVGMTVIKTKNIDLQKHHVKLSKDGFYYDNELFTSYQNPTDFTTDCNLVLFARRNSETDIAKGKLIVYSFKLYQDDIMVQNLIPAKRKSDNVIGMYDMVSRQFFTNAGSGSFTGA